MSSEARPDYEGKISALETENSNKDIVIANFSARIEAYKIEIAKLQKELSTVTGILGRENESLRSELNRHKMYGR